jgi:hypothetical protein
MKWKSVCLALFFTASVVVSDPHQSSSIEGFVTLNAVTHLAGVTIGVDRLGQETHLHLKTNTSGHYLFEEVQPGAYSMWADAKGYGCILIPRVAVHYGERVRQDFNFVRGQIPGGCEPVEKNDRK